MSEFAPRNAIMLHPQQPIFVSTKVPLTPTQAAVNVATAIESRLWLMPGAEGCTV
jgi:hypothetical protein